MQANKTLGNLAIHRRGTRKTSGISPIISTLIISGTLLVILIIASFVSTNILELQIANTEFEQAKTNMLLMDDVVQDTALRLGSGSTVQFNQRNGGIGINETTQKIQIVGPTHQTNVTRPPTSTSPISGGWSNPSDAFADDQNVAYITSSNPSVSQTYSGYDFNIPSSPSTSIAKVQVRIDARTEGDERIRLQVHNGTMWLPSSPIVQALNTSWVTYWFAVTSHFRTAVAVNQMQTKVEAVTNGQKDSQVHLDFIAVEVSYSTDVIYESHSLVCLVYSGGSRVSATDLPLRGDSRQAVNMTQALGYLRVELDQGAKIKLDYHRVRYVELETLLVGNQYTNFVEITFLRIVRGNTGGSETVNVKVQNVELNRIPHVYEGPSVTIRVQTDGRPEESVNLNHLDPQAARTVIVFTEAIIQVSTA